jgi:hypothetical protein
MNPGDEFEEIVAATIKEFDVFSGPNVNVFQRKVYPGAKDPNGYQIDISIELRLAPGLFFLIIIECKDHARPIERSDVQQFIQVRDDISAHKAIIVSTKGFNRGAIRLAESNRIALWQWTEPGFYVVYEQWIPERFLNKMREEAVIKGSVLYFQKRGITIKEDSLLSERSREYPFLLENKKIRSSLILSRISSVDLPSAIGYIDVDTRSKIRETFFLDIASTVLQGKTSEAHELQSYINSQYEKIHQKYPHFALETETKDLSEEETQNFKREEDEKFPWEDEEEESS